MARSVLIVDDDELVRDMLWRNMSELGFEVSEASDGPSALERVAERGFDLVILDYAMPGMSGPATAQEIRRKRPGQALLLISGYAGTGMLRTGSGEIPLLGKPFLLEELREAVDGALAHQS
ncbi:MAG: response regulator [Alphaproteobacteria bacterium]|nr:response regulator [Alphaproteobacteria bacterium]